MARRAKQRQPRRQTPKEMRRQRRNLREQRTLLGGAGIVLALIVLILGFGYYRENIAAARAPVAVVNGQPIMIGEYQQMVKYQRFNLMTSLGSQVNPQALVSFLEGQLPQTVLESMIDQVFIEQKAAEDGITVTKEEVQESIERTFGFTGDEPTPTPPAGIAVTDTIPSDFVTREEFNEAFNNFLQVLGTEAGLSESQYREIVRGEVLRDKVLEQIGVDVPATAPLTPSELDQVRQERFRQWLDEQRASADIQRFWTPAMVPPLPAGLSASQSPPPPLPSVTTPTPAP